MAESPAASVPVELAVGSRYMKGVLSSIYRGERWFPRGAYTAYEYRGARDLLQHRPLPRG